MVIATHEKLGRRRFIAIGAATIGTVAATSGVAHAFDKPAQSLLGMSAGTAIGPLLIERVAMRDGAARIEATANGTRFRVDILRRSRSPRALGETDDLSLYLCNHGNGSEPTDEACGVGVLTLANYLQAAKPEVPPNLMSYDERRSAHSRDRGARRT